MNGIIYKNWAFRFFVYFFIINVILFFTTVYYTNLYVDNYSGGKSFNYLIINILNIIFFIGVIVFLIASFIRKEKRDFKFYIPLFGIFLIYLLIILLEYFFKH
jgi:hypothetical protein